jgi:MFS family permease
MALTAILPVSASTYGILCGSLFLLGFFMGLTDISMNAVVSIFEKQDDKQIMATSHGFFSLGGIVGAPLGSLIAGYELNPVLQMSVTAVVILLLVVFVIMPPSVGYSDRHSDQAIFAIPRGPLIPLAIMAFCTMMSEGSVADWSAIYLKDVVKAPDQLLGFGYAAFSLTMTFGRFYGDSLIALIGPRRVLLAGFSIAVIGFLITLYPEFYTSLFGFALIGAGFASIIPVLFSTAGNMEGVSSSYGITAVATAGYAGFLIGPVMIGYVAEYQSLKVSFVLLIIVVGVALTLVQPSFRSR